MPEVRFSIVTPNLNMGRHLQNTLESVVANLGARDEYFVVDGGSSDDSVEIIRAYEHRLSGWVSEPDQGYADAIAKGFARCNGDLLCWVNSGDLLLRGALDAARFAFAETGADMIFGDDVYIDEEDHVIQVSRGDVSHLRNAMLYGGWSPLQDACYWTKALYEKVGGINRTLRYAADYDLFMRFALEGKCVRVPYIFSAFRRHPGQMSIGKASAYRAEREKCRSRYMAQFAETGPRGWKQRGLFWLAVRLKARFMSSWRKDSRLVGALATSLECRRHR